MFSITTLLTRNLHDVFGENDSARRRAILDGVETLRRRFSSGIHPKAAASG
jgi:hypothetical protein